MTEKIIISKDCGIQNAEKLVNIASDYKSDIYLILPSKKINCKSIMGILSLALKSGNEITIMAKGYDEKKAIDAIIKFLQ